MSVNRFPFIACEIFTCEVDIILKALVDDEELMNLLFSFLEPVRPHSALLAGYFSKVLDVFPWGGSGACIITCMKTLTRSMNIEGWPSIRGKPGVNWMWKLLMEVDALLHMCLGNVLNNYYSLRANKLCNWNNKVNSYDFNISITTYKMKNI
ncbi:PREDICTED: uncharacterized protein LOC109169181 [Ipomoea nil]|uniref:uncharacterized protein LOC109169181 n=1 Tax=Ipomoea nil TaxID=35883 RepID=UPI000901CCC3|nr:PREDICTED: uncharacterized protein LOC109169181 [Ipomoea nil]